jgi:hypothetical protein
MHGLIITRKYTDPLAYPDSWTESGARTLAIRIKAYWFERGQAVRVRIDHVSLGGQKLAGGLARTVWCVRSDMVNGLPRRGN